MALRLRPFQLQDEAAVVSAAADFQGTWFNWEVAHSEGQTWAQYLKFLEGVSHGENLPEGWVRGLSLAAEVNNILVGRASVRLELNEELRRRGGHIGYAVLPEFRRKGYATEILRQCLEICKEHGIDRALVTCNDDNVASIKVIEACGGVLEVVEDIHQNSRRRRYWIDCR